jgi:uncharacterized protein
MPERYTLHLPEKHLSLVQQLLQQHIPQAEVLAYGSRVNGDYYEASDLDLVARFPHTLPRKVFRLAPVQDAFVESNLPIIVQIVDWEGIPDSFHDEILAGYVVIQKG